jgi:hypothetical protein
MHTHPAMVAIFLTDQHSRHTYSDKTTEEMTGKAGEARRTIPLIQLGT